MNIFQKMAAITAEMKVVPKALDVPTGGTKSYKAVSERDIIDAVKPLEEKHGVYSYPLEREILESSMLENEKEYNGKVTRSTTFFSRVRTVYRFVNVEKPDEFIDMTTFAEGIDTGDKGSGKAMTYADKYALMKAYKISTGDDPDQNASEENDYKKADKPKYTKPSKESFAAARAEVEFSPTCAVCGCEISDKVHDFSVKKFGKPLCMEHQKNAT